MSIDDKVITDFLFFKIKKIKVKIDKIIIATMLTKEDIPLKSSKVSVSILFNNPTPKEIKKNIFNINNSQ